MTTIMLKRLAANAMAWMMVIQLRNDANVKVYSYQTPASFPVCFVTYCIIIIK